MSKPAAEGGKTRPTAGRRRLLPSAALMLAGLAFCAPFLLTSRALGGGDFDSYHRPRADHLRDEFLKSGSRLRWWPANYAGTPLVGDTQGGYPGLYFPDWLWIAFPADSAWEVLAALHVLLAAAGLYRLARHFRISRGGAALAGIAFGLSFAFVARLHAGHYGPMVAVALSPLVLRGFLRLAERPALGRFLEAAVMGALLLSVGQPGFIYPYALAAGVSTIARMWTFARDRRDFALRLGLMGAAVVAAAGLAAPSLAPGIEMAAHSTRPALGAVYGGTDVPLHHAFVPENLLYFLLPDFPWTPEAARLQARDYWHEKGVFIGLLPLLCAVASLAPAGRRESRFAAGVVLVALLASMARHVPLHSALSALFPGWSTFRIPARTSWVAVPALALMAGFGWDRVREGTAIRWLGGGLAFSLVVMVAAVVRLRVYPEAAVLLAFAAAAAVLLRYAPRWSGATACAVALSAAHLVLHAWTRLPLRMDPPAAFYERHIGEERKRHRLLDMRAYGLGPASRGFHLIRGYGHPVPAGLARYYGSAWKEEVRPGLESLGAGMQLARPDVLDRLNVRWIVAGTRLDPRWIEIADHASYRLYENPGARGPAFLEGQGAVEVDRRGDHLRLKVRAAGPDRLVLSESWMPGWSATLDGRPVPVEAVDGALLGVKVPRGPSEIELVYAPASLRTGRWIAGTTLLVSLGAVGAWAWRRRRSAENASAKARAVDRAGPA